MRTSLQLMPMLLACLGGSAFAAPEAGDEGAPICSEFGLSDASPLEGARQVSAGRITPGPALHLDIIPGKACTAGGCKADLTAGASGVQIRRYKSWACVVIPGKGKLATLTGWIPASRWSPGAPTSSVPSATWVGIWQNDHAKLTVTAAEGPLLHLEGHALWQGGSSPHFGEFDFDATPQGDTVSLKGGCEVHIRKVGDFLFAQDNKACGAPNVTFDGLYRYRSDLKP